MTRTLTRPPGSVIAGSLPRVDQRVTPAQRQIGNAALDTTARFQIAAANGATNSTKKSEPARESSGPVLNGAARPLTDRQRLALDFISDHIRKHGFPPTLREIGAEMSIRSTNGVNDHLRALERKGYIQREDMQSRAIRVVGMQAPLRCPDEPAPAPVVTLIQVDREVLARALAKFENLGDWIPRPVADRYEAAIDDLRVALLRGSR